MPKYECDCGAVYSTLTGVHACAMANHGRKIKMTKMKVVLSREVVTRIIEVHASAKMDGALSEDAISAVLDQVRAEVEYPGWPDEPPTVMLAPPAEGSSG